MNQLHREEPGRAFTEQLVEFDKIRVTHVHQRAQLPLEPIDEFRTPEDLDGDKRLLLAVIALVDRTEAAGTESPPDFEPRRTRKIVAGLAPNGTTNDRGEGRLVAGVSRRDTTRIDTQQRAPGIGLIRSAKMELVGRQKLTQHLQGFIRERRVSRRGLPYEALSGRRISLQRSPDDVLYRALAW